MLKLEKVSVFYGKREVVASVSAHLPSGSITALMGRNGIGKSTLLSAVAGLLPYEGRVFWQDTPLGTLKEREKSRMISYLPQLLRAPSVTVRELVGYGRTPHLAFPYCLGEEDKQTVEEALRRVGLTELALRDISTLSGGELQRAYLAMALAKQAPVLLLDEPFSHIDIAGIESLSSLLRTLAEEGKIILLSVHDPSLAVRLADHILLLQEKRECFFGTKEEALRKEVIEQVLGVRRYKTENGMLFFA